MRLTRILAIVAMAGSFGLAIGSGDTQAQIREQQPAEFPPASYKGKQYVDSKGCVFIRAGIDGNVSWVPRVSRDRKTICGFRPSLSGQVATAAPAPAPAAEPPVQITLDAAPAATATAPAPAPQPQAAPAPRRTVQAPAPKPRRTAPVVVRQTAPRPAPQPRVVAAAPAPQIITPAPQVRRTVPATAQRGASACPGASPISQQYLRGSGVRCGPQSEPIVGARVTTAAPRVVVPQSAAPVRQAGIQTHFGTASAVPVTSTTRIVPKHVAENRVNTRNVTVPHGYREVWDDDRLNPYRAEQNLAGRSQMLLIWTQTVPRRLIDQRTGRDVTASVPLIYPYTSVAQQQRELGEVTIVQRNGQTVKRVIRHAGAKPIARQPVYSTRSAPKTQVAPKAAAPTKAYAGARFVQVGTYRNPANAQRAAQTIARMGMRARIGKRGSTMTVQAGPFAGQQALATALQRLRGAGYADAFAR